MPEERVRQRTQDITLFFPAGDGVKENSHTATYKSIKNLKIGNGNNGLALGLVSFETKQNGKITTPAMWRLKEPLAGDAR